MKPMQISIVLATTLVGMIHAPVVLSFLSPTLSSRPSLGALATAKYDNQVPSRRHFSDSDLFRTGYGQHQAFVLYSSLDVDVVESTLNETTIIETSNNTATDALISEEPGTKEDRRTLTTEQVQLAVRSCVTALSVVTTWALIQATGWSTVRGAGVHAVVASLLSPSPAYATASLAGTFAGMTGLVATWHQMSLLGLATGAALYAWERGAKVHPGKGGRLGTMAVLGHLGYLTVTRDARLGGLIMNILETLQAPTVIGLLASAVVLTLTGRGDNPTRTKQYTGLASKTAIVSLLLSKTLQVASPLAHLQSIVATFLGAWAVKSSKFLVFPVGVVCSLGSLLPGPSLAIDVAMGSFAGLTRLEGYSKRQLLQASIAATLFLYTQTLLGVGGRLGLFAFLGVLFSL